MTTLAKLKDLIKRDLKPKKEVEDGDTLSALGADSLDWLDFRIEVEDEFKMEWPIESYGHKVDPKTTTIARMAELLDAEMGGEG